jgi:toxin ParE1/3/4
VAQVEWTESALSDLDAIADYIALDNQPAASKFVTEVFNRVELLEDFPEMCPHPHDLPDQRYRHLSIPPARIFYRVEADIVHIIYVMRAEKLLRLSDL